MPNSYPSTLIGAALASALLAGAASAADVCAVETPYTALAHRDFVIRLYEPDDLKHPEIWQGPICVYRPSATLVCGVDLSLLRDARVEGQYLHITQFSGSNLQRVRMELATCRIEDRPPRP